MATSPDVPFGIKILQRITRTCCPYWRPNRDLWYRSSVLLLTFLSYTSYHLSRKPISIVKIVLHQNCTGMTPPPGLFINQTNKDTWCDWVPFDGNQSDTYFGMLDSAFLFAYAFGMFLSGFVAERVNLRYFLTFGMLFSGIFTYLFGIAYTERIHSLFYFMFVQAAAGFAQTTGWPGVVTAVGNWFGKGKRGLIFGLWNSHTSLGNILGSLIAGEFVEDNWGLSFIVPGAVIAGMGFIVFLFLVTNPKDVGCLPPDYHGNKQMTHKPAQRRWDPRNGPPLIEDISSSDSETEVLLGDKEYPVVNEDTPILENISDSSEEREKQKAISFMGALRIPGVIEFSLSLFFAKLVSYTFLYWLPRYIKSSTPFSPTQSANLSTLFDVGGIIGGIIAGVISDYSGMSATTCGVMLNLAIPMLFVYDHYGSMNLETNILLLMAVGLLVNGPYALITTAVSAELGTHHSLRGNSKALATVTAIIDGTGSIGAAVGPLLAGPISGLGWEYVFYMLMAADVMAFLLLIRLIWHELKRFAQHRREQWQKELWSA